MILIILFLSSCLTWAGQPVHWSYVLEITEKHEFYKNDQVVEEPKDSWQHLFALAYLNGDLLKMKDCIFFRVPGNDPGVLKIKTLSFNEKCDDHLLRPGDKELIDLKSLHYIISDKQVLFDMTFQDLHHEKWSSQIQGSFVKPVPRMALSSAEFKSPKIILLTSETSPKKAQDAFLKDNEICHDVNEDCSETSPSQCNRCAEGWYEVPNGCASGPKFCGHHNCGQKDGPACRRGMKWQRKETQLDCVTDSSFAYCSKGLSVQCVGKKAYCR